MITKLLEKAKMFQKNQKNFNEILYYFNSTIKYIGYKLKYPEAESDLIIYLHQLLRRLNLNRFKEDKDLLAFINKCLKNRSITLFYNNAKEKERINLISETEVLDSMNYEEKNDEYSDVFFMDLISSLNPKQKQITFCKYYLQLSDIEIAKMFKMSRQGVNQAKRLALKKLKVELLS
ncbi:sigma-70 family RNA polymerase sigma factor [Clostridium saccharobutylicum]|uniref:RNA polymerase sigma factor, sigma-70 family n=1 Tax=Clostridium saccharobutylicum DSM 13864 TaxID=1345695 RepID=U5MYW7_CLOSA|nr:sigma-70 family RNA polymerase sigma factor [Clostridium saccharobutylicum]AGX44697.1 RNA polymerase sigma factor, sigma-70 family [Clostridium saccharobutylicum DSM 13864]AQR91986.1 hypothetical protein CLOSC_37140 [Clostridium saccharobutylicum]AQS01888.1 hypothetical protein CSACC_37190 [Clostridium saccharobutylicum]AQS11488.1 hypothetical protein CLOBY_36440 [Clostridium saccharobutylicum]AQS15871.1 hypothetical protein CLOSACC_37190 [Clostridium saccharobutylicum]